MEPLKKIAKDLPRGERFLRRKQLPEKVGLPMPTIHREIAAGHFPKPYRLTLNTSGWKESEIDQWMADRPRQGDALVGMFPRGDWADAVVDDDDTDHADGDDGDVAA